MKEEYDIIEKIALENKEYIGDEMIIKERHRIYHMDYASSQKYISQVFKEAINAKSSHYIDLKEFQWPTPINTLLVFMLMQIGHLLEGKVILLC